MAETTEKQTAAPPVLKALLGQKVGMTQVFDTDGSAIPVTVVRAGPCPVVQVRTKERHGYDAIQVAFGDRTEKSANRPDAGQFKKRNLPLARWLREFRVASSAGFEAGQTLKADVFVPGDLVDVGGISKGKGFAGTVKRHHFSGGPSTHGQSDRQRAPGSIGSSTYPARVFKGMRMSGHMGARTATIQHLEIVQVHPDKNLLVIRGAIPGPNRALVTIRETVKRVKVNALRVSGGEAKTGGKDSGKAKAKK